MKCLSRAESGIPYSWINLRTLQIRQEATISIAEAGSIQMEFRALGQALRNRTYIDVSVYFLYCKYL